MFEVIRTKRAGLLRLEGEIDMSDADALASILRDERAKRGRLTLDLSAVSFMNSSGLKVLLQLAAESASPASKGVARAATGGRHQAVVHRPAPSRSGAPLRCSRFGDPDASPLGKVQGRRRVLEHRGSGLVWLASAARRCVK